MASSFGPLGLSILGVGRQYPPHALRPDALETLSRRFYPDSPAMQKVLSINRYTGIDARSSIGTPDHPLVNQAAAPSIAELSAVFFDEGVPLAVRAAEAALAEARVGRDQITHVVSTTCTHSANPGFDHFVAKQLGLGPAVEKVLLHGVGCSGGLAALRTAANLALGHAQRGRPARVLVVALELSTTMVRSELDSIHARQETRIGVALFSDCGSALVLTNGLGAAPSAAPPVYDLLGWDHRILPDTEADLGFDVDPLVVLSPRVPQLTTSQLGAVFADLVASVPALPPAFRAPADFDWALHPGGATILTGAERALGITPEHMRASYDTYMGHGNSSSATIFSVLDRLRHKDMDALAPGGRPPAPYVVACAFGPGIAVESCLLRRGGAAAAAAAAAASGINTPPETESEASRSEAGDAEPETAEAAETAAASAVQQFVDEALRELALD